MKKRVIALVMICTMIMTTPVFAGTLTKEEVRKDLAGIEAGVQACKQAVDTAQTAENDAKYRLDNAAKELDLLKDKKVTFVRPDGMSKKEAEGIKKSLEHDIHEAEKYLERCKKEYGYAVDDRNDADHNLAKQWNDYAATQKVLETAK